MCENTCVLITISEIHSLTFLSAPDAMGDAQHPAAGRMLHKFKHTREVRLRGWWVGATNFPHTTTYPLLAASSDTASHLANEVRHPLRL